MLQLTLRTLLAYLDDTLEPEQARALGKRVAESEEVKELVERIKKVTRRRGLATPGPADPGDTTADPNTVAAYLDNTLDSATLKQIEELCLKSDVHLAEVAACHQILTLVLTEPARVPPHAHRRMYKLVPAPASEPTRGPSRVLPIGGAAPPADDEPESDVADAALLLGLNRYSSATTWAARLALFGAAAVLLVLLTGAALLSLQRQKETAPETAAGHSSLLNEPVVVVQVPVPPPKPKDVVVPPKPKDKEPEPVAPMPPPRPLDLADVKPVDPGPGLGDPIPPPSEIVRDIATVRTPRVLVVTQPAPGGPWVRLRVNDKDDIAIESNKPVMALPGYKADVSVEKKVLVRLWGNVPEQLPYRVLESRVKFHVPAPQFDADITLLGGRIYLKSEKETGAKVRVRLGTEVWDITLPDEKSDVLVELVSWYSPNTLYARKGGVHPRLEGRTAVVFGSAEFETRGNRFKKVAVPRWNQITWDSVTGTLSDPALIAPDFRQRELLLDRDPSDPLRGELYKQVTRLLTAAADRVTTRDIVGAVIKERIGPDLPDIPPADRDLVSRLSVYARAALADGTAEGAQGLTVLVDVLRSELPWLARQAVVTALVHWVARDVGNTERLHPVLVEKGLSEIDADRLLQLLRGFVSPFKPDPAALDKLVDPAAPGQRSLLGDAEVALREAALWNLMAVKLEQWVPLPLGVNVGAVGAKVDSVEYTAFLKAMRAEVDAIKKRNAAPPPKP